MQLPFLFGVMIHQLYSSCHLDLNNGMIKCVKFYSYDNIYEMLKVRTMNWDNK